MPNDLEALKAELEGFGEANDRSRGRGPGRMLNITRDTGEFLAVLVRAASARRILEIGTSNGYSTLWLAEAARAIAGHVTTVELSDDKVRMAAANFERARLAAFVTQVHADAGAFLRGAPEAGFDLVFLDSERDEYVRWWPDLRRVVRPGGVIVIDNSTSHPEEVRPLVDLMEAAGGFTRCLVPVGKGEIVAVRHAG